ncbi:serine/threonine protein kinase [Streptoalloteichus tenebrarius]|uniref:non-specific serine/threonine protein kinase n=1 Tax=Streptoalloteichus tenebrarius (strain ATCC 17920 / DSM 40477 / JCM 4838 / CBS 697.72 / NBRC 16177 / NCIMB 11028 / NRRL B-12390 / A12253. 1 / ISP 5477) TaxID=1933 RepID=A0ABT1HMI5_STRSD|nr:serine/threonine protein kinase [Streptoalloteichus tenebrarius]
MLEHRYRVDGLLARGGMSVVYRGLDTRLDRPVAIKVMDDRFSGDRKFTERFEREARAAARLHHPGIVAVHDQGVDRRPDGDRVFLVMELVEGGTLRDLLRERGALPVPVALSVLDPVLSALAAAHSAGLVHRDVKPENVLIGRGGVVKVADFGLVRAVAEAGTTSASVILGTVAYLAPEQVATGAADARSDVYSAGLVLYEMLTGVPPYTGDTALSVAYRHVNDDVPPPSASTPGIPPALDELVVQATRRDPAARPQDAAAFLLALQRVRATVGVDRVPVPTPAPVAAVAAASPGGHPSAPGAPADDDPPTQRIPAVRDDSADPADSGPTQRLAPTAMATMAYPAPPSLPVGPQHGHHPSGPQPLGPQGTRAMSRADLAPSATPPGGTPTPPGGTAGQPGAGEATKSGRSGGARRAGASAAARLRPSRRVFVLWIAVVLVVASVIGGVAWWLGSGRWATVPKVANFERATAENVLRNADLVPRFQEEHDDAVEQGKVVRTDPNTGVEVLRGTEVTVVVSKGRPKVPSVAAGTALQDAEAAIRDAKLTPRTDKNRDEYHESVPEGRVVRLDPEAGTPAPVGTEVTIILSKGAKPLPVPDVRGMSKDEAFAALRKEGFEPYDAGAEFSEQHDAGKVVTTKPGPGETLSSGQSKRVGVVVSNAVTVPRFAGSSLQDAKKAADDLKLKLRAKGLRPDKHSLVLGQSVAPGTKVKAGTEVEVETFP